MSSEPADYDWYENNMDELVDEFIEKNKEAILAGVRESILDDPEGKMLLQLEDKDGRRVMTYNTHFWDFVEEKWVNRQECDDTIEHGEGV